MLDVVPPAFALEYRHSEGDVGSLCTQYRKNLVISSTRDALFLLTTQRSEILLPYIKDLSNGAYSE